MDSCWGGLSLRKTTLAAMWRVDCRGRDVRLGFKGCCADVFKHQPEEVNREKGEEGRFWREDEGCGKGPEEVGMKDSRAQWRTGLREQNRHQFR